MGLSVSYTIIHNHAGSMAEALHGLLAQVVRKHAFDIEGQCKARSRVDTGAMRAGWYTATFDLSGYENAAAAAVSAGGKDIKILPAAMPTNDLEAIVSNAVLHAIYNEMGTVRMSAQPMASPAVETVRPAFMAAVAAAVAQAARA